MTESSYKVVGVVEDSSYAERLRQDAKKREKGIYPRTIMIGLGGTGAKALIHLRRLVLERFGAVSALDGVAYLSVDTDVRSQNVSAEEERKSPLDNALSFQKDERVNVKVDFKNYIGPNIIHHPQIREWWDEAALPSSDFNLEAGAGQIRPLSRLAFFTNKGLIQEAVERAYRKVSGNSISSDRVDTQSPVRVVIVTGLAGGTGSGMSLDLPALVSTTLEHHERPKIEGFFVLPGGFSGVESGTSFPKVAANGFAALREINHYLTTTFSVRWEPTGSRVEARGLYQRYVLFSGTNASGQQLSDLGDCYRTIGETLFLDFGAGPMAGWVQGVRVNREQYLNSAVTYTYRLPQADGSVRETHTDEWRNAFSSIGFSKLVSPAWRLLNKAKYELAAEMVGLLDPGRQAEHKGVMTRNRDRFMAECGFLQGELVTDEGNRQVWQVRDRLARQTGTGKEIQSVFEHLDLLKSRLAEDAESMFAQGTTTEECEDAWKRVANLWGDPTTDGEEGDWAREVVKNRRALIREVEAQIPKTIENFRKKRAVGISGTVAILQSILETLDRPADQARYTEFFRRQIEQLPSRSQEAKVRWDRRVQHAEQAAKGTFGTWGRSEENHRKAVEMAGQALYEYWEARIKELISVEGCKVLEEIRSLLREQLTQVEGIAERMSRLEAQYRKLAEFYSVPQRSYVVQEINFAADADPLAYYLGREGEERREKLAVLLDRGLRRMGLDTLETIGLALSGEHEKFRDNLSAQAFYALRGESGWTSSFTDNPDKPHEGFIERHSILRVLKELTDVQRKEKYKELYQKGLPWGRKNQTQALVNLHEPHGDAFIGCIAEGYEDIVEEMVGYLKANADAKFEPQQIRAYDPAEIILYTELTAFPVYYLSEISGLKSHYDRLLNDTSSKTALHLHQDYHRFQPIVPYDPGQVASFQKAWSLFLQAQMLGLVCSVRQAVDDDRRILFQWRRKVGPFEVQWSDLGAEGQVIRRLMSDSTTARQMRSDVREAQDRLLESRSGSWQHLVALADYFYYCIFPVRGSSTAFGDTGPLGSMQNLVASTLRQEWRSKVTDGNVEYRVRELLETLDRWSRPTSRDAGQLVPRTLALKPEERLDEWGLLEIVDQAIDSFIRRGEIIESRDSQGNRLNSYPRLALCWDYFEQIDLAADDGEILVSPAASEEGTWHYAGAVGKEHGLTLAEIAERVRQAPKERHRVWAAGMEHWQDAVQIPMVAEMLASIKVAPPPDETMPSPDEVVPSPDEVVPPPDEVMPPPDEVMPPPDEVMSPSAAESISPDEIAPPPLTAPTVTMELHYARDDERIGCLSAIEVARQVEAHPASVHKVWAPGFGSDWKVAHEVPVVAKHLISEPPPLPSRELGDTEKELGHAQG